jgi:hypothetical protein
MNKKMVLVCFFISLTTLACSQFEFNNGVIIRYTGLLNDVIIPESINGQKVTAIGDRAFYIEILSNKKGINSVIIPNSVISIGDEAFYNNNLSEVIIPDSVTSIGQGAFAFNKLTSISIPNSVISLKYEAFSHNNLTTISLSDTMTTIDTRLFFSNKITIVNLPNSVTSIGVQAFAENSIDSITIGGDVEFSSDAFSGSFIECYNLHGKIAGTYFRNQYGFWRAEARVREQNWYRIIASSSGNHENQLYSDIDRTNGIFDSRPTLRIPYGQKYIVYISSPSAIVLKNYPNYNVISLKTSNGNYILVIIDIGEKNYISDEIITIEYKGLIEVNPVGIIQNKQNNVWLMHFSME